MNEFAGRLWKDRGIFRPLAGSIVTQDNLTLVLCGSILNHEEHEGSLLESYRKWGKDCAAKLSGSFSFVIWDQNKRELTCFRDQLGTSLFYYIDTKEQFAFASDIETLLRFGIVEPQSSEERIGDFIVGELEGFDKTSTFYRGIHRLKPASVRTVKTTESTESCYWKPPVEVVDRSAEEFREVLREAVRCRIDGPGETGVMLSGGMDSSAIVGVAVTTENIERLKTFSGISTANQYTRVESEAILTMIKHFPVDADIVDPQDTQCYLPAFDRLLRKSNNLFDFELAHIPLAIYSRAEALGFSSILDGVDGDVVCSQRTGIIPFLLQRGRWLKAVQVAKGISKFYEESWIKELWRQGKFFWVPENHRVKKFWRRRLGENAAHSVALETGLNPEFAEAINLSERMQQAWLNRVQYSKRNPNARHANGVLHPHISSALERYRRVAALFGIEARSPFFDQRVVELCSQLPWQKRAISRLSKPFLREAMKGVLPASILTRKNFEHAGNEFWLKILQYKKEDMLDSLSATGSAIAFYQPEFVARAREVILSIDKIQHSARAEFESNYSLIDLAWRGYLIDTFRYKQKRRSGEFVQPYDNFKQVANVGNSV